MLAEPYRRLYKLLPVVGAALMLACSGDLPAPFAPAPKPAIEDDSLVAVAGDSLYCRDAAFWRAYCRYWGELEHGGCDLIDNCTDSSVRTFGVIESDTAYVRFNPSEHGWLRVPQRLPVTRLQRWTHPAYVSWDSPVRYEPPAPPDSIGLVRYPFRFSSGGLRTLYGFPSPPMLTQFFKQSEQPKLDDRAVLIAFYTATGGGSAWTGENWGSDAPIGTWQGVTTDQEGRVIRLGLVEDGLTGSIPPELGQLTNLQHLYLQSNQLTGSIPRELGQLTNLQSLELYDNQLTGSIPPALGQLTNLQFLGLDNNQLTGSILPALGQLTNLQHLGLSDNQLTGSIPPELGQLTNLQSLYLHGNQLTGSIPSALGQLTNLHTLWLGGNQLTGSIPPALGQLTNLQHLGLSGNNLSGCIPAGLQAIPSNDLGQLGLSPCDGSGSLPKLDDRDRAVLIAFYTATGGGSAWTGGNWGSDIGTWEGVTTDQEGRVIRLELSESDLTGSIPPELGQLTNLQTLVLSGTQLTGSIPRELGQLTNLQHLWLHSTQLTGSIPSALGQLTNLQGLGLNDNQLTGSIPSALGQLTNLQVLGLHTNQLTGSIPPELGQLTNLQYLGLSGNNLSGCIPAGLQAIPSNDLDQLGLSPCDGSGSLPKLDDRAVLIAFYTATGGGSAWTGENWGSDEPIGTWQGVITDQEGRVIRLELFEDLTGSIPRELGQLTNLQALALVGTQLTGSIPPELGQLTNLQALELSNRQFTGKLTGSIPRELGQLTNLQYLGLYGNQLTGSIPRELGQLTNLQSLALGTNQLTGSIPRELGQLTNLQALELNSNQLTGSIPPALGQLTNLQSLWLGANQLTGSIPRELGQLTNLQVLMLFFNQLTGSIPPALGQLTNLQTLGLSGNTLSGCIPASLQAIPGNDLDQLGLSPCDG